MEAALAPTDWSKVMDFNSEDQPRFALDSKLFVQFYLRPVMLQRQSEIEDRPIYEDVEHVRIMVPGDKLSIIDRVASSDDKKRFAEHYAKFTSGKGQEVVGTRLDVVPWMTRSKVEEYKFFGIHTIEQLSVASDEVGQKFPSFQSDKARCLKFLEATNGTDARVKALEAQVAELLASAAQRQEAMNVVTGNVKIGTPSPPKVGAGIPATK